MATPSPSDREMASKAIKAVEPMGFPREVTNRVLKRLFKTYQSCWAHIMADNYAVLVEALLEETTAGPQPQVDEEVDEGLKKKTGCGGVRAEPEPKKVLRQVKVEEEQPSLLARNSDMPTSGSLKRQRMEVGVTPELHPSRSEGTLTDSTPFQSSVRPRTPLVVSSQPQIVKKSAEAGSSHPPRVCGRPEFTSAQMNRARRAATGAAQEKAAPASGSMLRRDKHPVDERAGITFTFKEPKIEPGTEGPSGTTGTNCYTMGNELEDKQYQTDSPLDEMPLASIPPERSLLIPAAREEMADHVYEAGPSTRTAPILLKNISQSSEVQLTDKNRNEGRPTVAMRNKGNGHEIQHVPEASSTQIDIASTSSGEVRLSFISSSDLRNFQMPSMEDVLREVEDRCLRSYRIRQPEFSLMKVMREMCECFLELGSEQTVDKREAMVNVTPALDALKKSGLKGMPGFSPMSRSQDPGPSSTNGSYPNKSRTIGMREESSVHEAANFVSNSSVVGPGRQLALPGYSRPPYDASDISKGEEMVRIPVANDTNAVMPSFHYIPHNISYQNAYINISLARIGDEDCCSDCYGDCLAAPIPCACARETGGEFAYTPDGLVKKKFLDECISMNLEPKAEQLFYCKSCPLERSKNEVMPDPCKGHTIRKFIKECWSKCGCNKQCGNRVVQRGITCNLQVFFTGKGKGWGVRTLDALPRGTFVCEYVGEILTNTELYDRTMETTGKARHTYPVLLDADWGTEGVLKDEEALCLDATFYGNVARFVNHRCSDASLVEIPVEVETPDRHYYHLAFFTTRNVEALEELNWEFFINIHHDRIQ